MRLHYTLNNLTDTSWIYLKVLLLSRFYTNEENVTLVP